MPPRSFLLAPLALSAACGEVVAPSPDPIDPDAPGHVVYLDGGSLYRVAATAGATPTSLSAALAPTGDLGPERRPNLSPDGAWLVFETADLGCPTSACLAVAPIADPGAAALLAPGGAPIDYADNRAAIADGGATVYFAATGVGHDRDVFRTDRTVDGWSTPVAVTAASPHPWNDTPRLTPDGGGLVVDCGPEANAGPGGSLCAVELAGGAVTIALSPDDAPASVTSRGPLHHGSPTADGLVFEADWDGVAIWRASAGGPVRLTPADVDDDHAPCALADGRLVTLRYVAGAPHLQVMAADGSGAVVLARPALSEDDFGCGR